MHKKKIYFNQMVLIFLAYILLISYVTSFQQTTKNENQLSSQKNIKFEPGTKDHLKVEFPNVPSIYGDTSYSSFSNAEPLASTEDDDVLTDMLSDEEIHELRGLVSSIQEMSVYDGVYHPFDISNSVQHRRRKRETDYLVQNLNDVAKNLELMVNSKVNQEKKLYFDKATSSLESYIKGAKASANAAKNTTLQIMKLDNNVLIVQCAGWLWYPISKLNKTITCTNGIMRFESRDRTLARACNLYNCMDLAL